MLQILLRALLLLELGADHLSWFMLSERFLCCGGYVFGEFINDRLSSAKE